MNERMFFKTIWLALALSSTLGSRGAFADVPCEDNVVSFLFFNGILTTRHEASISARRMRDVFGNSASNGRRIAYDYLYNDTQGFFADTVETLHQRLKEQDEIFDDRSELIFEILSGREDILSKILEVFPEYEAESLLAKQQLVENMATSLHNQADSEILEDNYQEHRSKLDSLIAREHAFVFFAHSQGNLFANAAYMYVLTKIRSDAVKVVHVAPASAKLYGPYTLADGDSVINKLRALGDVPDANSIIPEFSLRPPGPYGSGTDSRGHGLWPIYLNEGLDPILHIKKDVADALDTVQPSSSGMSCASLPLSGNFRTIPATMAGFVATNNACPVPAEPGAMTFSASGAVNGSGCFEKINYAAGLQYSFSQESGSSSLQIHDVGTKSILLAEDDTPPPLFKVNLPAGYDPDFPAGSPIQSSDTSFSQSLAIDIKSRVLDNLGLIEGKPCNAIYYDAHGTQVELDGAHVERSAAALSVKGGTQEVAHVAFSDLFAADLHYGENYLFVDEFSMRFGANFQGANPQNVGIIVPQLADLSKFTFTASVMAPDNSWVAISCVSP